MTKRDELIALGGVGVKLKPLEWPPRCPRGQRVHNRPALVNYTVAHYGGDVGDAIYRWAEAHSPWSDPLPTYEAAKAAAQADYEQRIRSALEDRRGLEPRGCPTPGACSCPTGRATPIAYITKAGLEKFRDGKEPESHVLLRSDGDLRVPLYDRDPIDLRWTTELSEIIGHLGSAIVQSTNSDDRIIMDHVRAAYEIAKVVRRHA